MSDVFTVLSAEYSKCSCYCHSCASLCKPNHNLRCHPHQKSTVVTKGEKIRLWAFLCPQLIYIAKYAADNNYNNSDDDDIFPCRQQIHPILSTHLFTSAPSCTGLILLRVCTAITAAAGPRHAHFNVLPHGDVTCCACPLRRHAADGVVDERP